LINLLRSPSDLTEPLAVVACDAGAANHIAAWSSYLPKQLSICAEGPARKLFEKEWPTCEFQSLESVIASSKMLLTGTGWSSNLEHDARRLAKDDGVLTIAVLDHWVNYRERFIRNNEEILPDIIVVTDNYAELEAKRCFEKKSIQIIQWPNNYLEIEVRRINLFRQKEVHVSHPPLVCYCYYSPHSLCIYPL
jgi:hypothetical protein